MLELVEAFHEEMTTGTFVTTLYTANQDSLLLHKLGVAYQNANEHEKKIFVNMCFDTLVEGKKETNTTKPHALQEKRTALTKTPICGAHARQTGKPCRQPAMRCSERCRLHGGKSTGRPVKKGLRAKAYQLHARHARQLVAQMLQAFHYK